MSHQVPKSGTHTVSVSPWGQGAGQNVSWACPLCELPTFIDRMGDKMGGLNAVCAA